LSENTVFHGWNSGSDAPPRLFVAVAEAKSFFEAARTLGLPKSSVSRAVARLEEELGVELIEALSSNCRMQPRREARLRVARRT
jgi:DNA-binding transcriptional LysR family regulator